MDAEHGKKSLNCGCEYWGNQLVPCDVHETADADEFVEREEAILALDADDLYELEMKLLGNDM